MATHDGTETSIAAPRPRKQRALRVKAVTPAREAVFRKLGLHACYEVDTLAGMLLEHARRERAEGFDIFAKVAAIRLAALSSVLMEVISGVGHESSAQVVEGISFAAFESELNAQASAKEIEA